MSSLFVLHVSRRISNGINHMMLQTRHFSASVSCLLTMSKEHSSEWSRRLAVCLPRGAVPCLRPARGAAPRGWHAGLPRGESGTGRVVAGCAWCRWRRGPRHGTVTRMGRDRPARHQRASKPGSGARPVVRSAIVIVGPRGRARPRPPSGRGAPNRGTGNIFSQTSR